MVTLTIFPSGRPECGSTVSDRDAVPLAADIAITLCIRAQRGLHLAQDFFSPLLRVSHKGRDGDWTGLGGSDDVFEGLGGMADA